jgi:hypothetical protein
VTAKSNDDARSRRAYMWLGFGFMLAFIGDGFALVASVSASPRSGPLIFVQIIIAVVLLLCANYFIVKMIKTHSK